MTRVDLDKNVHLVEADVWFVLKLTIGFVFIAVGVVGLFIPMFPDIVFIIIGLMFFDYNGRIRHFLINLLPKKHRERAHSMMFIKNHDKMNGEIKNKKKRG